VNSSNYVIASTGEFGCKFRDVLALEARNVQFILRRLAFPIGPITSLLNML